MVDYADAMRAESVRANDAFSQLIKRGCGNPVDDLQSQLAVERLENQKLRNELAEKDRHIEELTATAPRGPFHGHKIAVEVAAKLGISLRELKSARRFRYLVEARQEAMSLMYEKTSLSMPQIGKILNRDHTTVLHGIRQHKKRLAAR